MDEFDDLNSLDVLRREEISDGVVKLVLKEGAGAPSDIEDIVYYKHETRFDNGQLVDLDERRKVADRVPMKDPGFHEYLRSTFFTMLKHEVAYLVLSPAAHNNMYHESLVNLSMIRTPEEKAKILASVGDLIYIKLTVANIKRDPKCD